MTDTLHVQILRQNNATDEPLWHRFILTDEVGTIADVLNTVNANPVTSDRVAVRPVHWDSGCGEGLCGSCSILVNGKPVLACQTLVSGLRQPIKIEPLGKLSVERDLSVSAAEVLELLKSNHVWIESSGTQDDGDSSVLKRKMTNLPVTSACMMCMHCQEVCPQFNTKNDFAGPLPLVQWNSVVAAHSLAHDTQKRGDYLQSEQGISGCANSQNCVSVCPVLLPLNEVMGYAARHATTAFLKKYIG